MCETRTIPARDVLPGMVIAFRAIDACGHKGECDYHEVTRCEYRSYNGNGSDGLIMHSSAGHSEEYGLAFNTVTQKILPLAQLELF